MNKNVAKYFNVTKSNLQVVVKFKLNIVYNFITFVFCNGSNSAFLELCHYYVYSHITYEFKRTLYVNKVLKFSIIQRLTVHIII